MRHNDTTYTKTTKCVVTLRTGAEISGFMMGFAGAPSVTTASIAGETGPETVVMRGRS